jgi:exopolysaccharide/PEP-CTERM locus tyrosine autokinase
MMPGNRIDMIERAAARLRRDAPAQKPVIDQRTPETPVFQPPNVVPLAPAPVVQPVAPPPAAAPPVVAQPAIAQPFIAPPVVAEPEAPPVPVAVRPAPAPTRPVSPAGSGKTSQEVVLDAARLALAGTIDWTADRTPVMEEFRLIKRRLLRRAFDPNNKDTLAHLVMVTSAKPREGKTFVTTNLAISISLEEDYHVLLVDADIRRQALRQNLGLEASKGFVDLLLDPHLDMADVLLKTNIPRLTVLPAGTMSDRAPELLAGSRMRELVDDIAKRYPDRIILFDTAPCLISSDAATLAAHVGQVLFVVEAEQTQQHEIIAALNLISACQEIALVLNKAPPLATTSYGGYGVY